MSKPSDYQRIQVEPETIEYEGWLDWLNDFLKRARLFVRYQFPWVVRSAGYAVQRAVRGYSDLDLSLHTERVIELAIRAATYHRDRGLTYPIHYDSENDYQEDLSEIIYGFEHWRAVIEGRETCSCCGKFCVQGCPIITEAKTLYFDLLDSMWE